MEFELSSVCGSLSDSQDTMDLFFECGHTQQMSALKLQPSVNSCFSECGSEEDSLSLACGSRSPSRAAMRKSRKVVMVPPASPSSSSSSSSMNSHSPSAAQERHRAKQEKLMNLYALLASRETQVKPKTSGVVRKLDFDAEPLPISQENVHVSLDFEVVCESVSKSMNSFLADTYVKSLLGASPFEKLQNKRRRVDSE